MVDPYTRSLMKEFTVLYVEDEESVRLVMTDLLKRKFKEVITAVNGKEGLEKYKQHKPDLIITDNIMPEMDGLVMVEHIREENMHIPIIIITAFSQLDNLSRSIELDVNFFVKKPPSKEEFDRALTEVTHHVLEKDKKEETKTVF